MQEFDIHKGKPPVDLAMKNLEGYILNQKRLRNKVMKVIVGYGSSGGTHKIKTASLEKLEDFKQTNKIKEYICCSDLDIFSVKYQILKDAFKKLVPEKEKKIKNAGAILIFL